MKLAYRKKRVYLNLVFGVLWLLMGIVQVVLRDSVSWLDYAWFLVAAAYIGGSFYQYYFQYLTIDNNQIKMNWIWGKKIDLREVNTFKKFAGDYILKSEDAKLTINTQIMDKESLQKLNSVLQAHELGPLYQ